MPVFCIYKCTQYTNYQYDVRFNFISYYVVSPLTHCMLVHMKEVTEAIFVI